ncbi:MAG: DNA-3-methyladenine glycosylase 2 family protein, partial [Lentisphaerae bacterium]|nr:DNA-3-methyladenine glycosylase 2 family protein [Lentisphaerota bacterium]
METTNNKKMVEAYKNKDLRFDGRFFVGNASIQTYCRPICRSKTTKQDKLYFFLTAAEAEQAGFQPCLLCRPELAPPLITTGEITSLPEKAIKMMEENCSNGKDFAETATELGVSDHELHRVFLEKYNVTPTQYLQTSRLHLARNLLIDTSISIQKVAMASGFSSLQAFNTIFKKHYQLTPTDLRKNASIEKKQKDEITLSLTYRPPHLYSEILRFLEGRAIPGVELVVGSDYLRTARIRNADNEIITGWLKVSNNTQKNALAVTLSESLLPVLSQALAKVRHLFDLYNDPTIVYEALASMNDIRPGLCVPGTRVPGSFDPFEMVVRAVLGQQITVKAATTLAGRFVNTFGRPVNTEIPELNHLFPLPNDIAALKAPVDTLLGPLGIITTRAQTIGSLAKTFVDNSVN